MFSILITHGKDGRSIIVFIRPRLITSCNNFPMEKPSILEKQDRNFLSTVVWYFMIA
jgi:hypothetical protein